MRRTIVTIGSDVAIAGECAVIGADHPLKGTPPIGFAIVKAGQNPYGLAVEIINRVRAELRPGAAFKQAHAVRALPTTRSGKILRAVLWKLANGETVDTPPTIEDPAVLDEFRAILAEIPLSAAQPA